MFDESTPDDAPDVADDPDGPARRQRTRDLGLIGSVKTRKPFGFAGSGQARMDEEDAYHNSRFLED